MTENALIGYSGFVGGSLARQSPFSASYNSSNIDDIRGRTFERVYCAGAPGVKWKANREPDADRASIGRLMSALEHVTCRQFILISTIDVYPAPVGVDEHSVIDRDRLTPYGRHRLDLEAFAQSRFSSLVVRLPGLFGPGLRKNAIYDLLHGNQLEAINPASVFQFYDMRHLAEDLETALGLAVPIVNFATEPVSVGEVAHEAFGLDFTNPNPPARQTYDMRTRHDAAFKGAGGYMLDRRATLARIADYVRSEGWVRP